MRNFPLFYYVVWGFGASQVLVPMPNLILSFIREPVSPNLVDLLVPVLSEPKEKEVVIYLSELPTVVIGSLIEIYLRTFQVRLRTLNDWLLCFRVVRLGLCDSLDLQSNWRQQMRVYQWGKLADEFSLRFGILASHCKLVNYIRCEFEKWILEEGYLWAHLQWLTTGVSYPGYLVLWQI